MKHFNIHYENGIAEATPIQEKAIPVIMDGKDVIGQAKTGTGKTLAFVLPILENIDPNASDIQALIVAPTRELALQITTEIKKMLVHKQDIHVLAIYGGQDVEQQMKKIKRKYAYCCSNTGAFVRSFTPRDNCVIKRFYGGIR